MIVVTGAAGFIGSCLIGKLNAENFNHIIAVDQFGDTQKERNLQGKKLKKVDRNSFFEWLDGNFRHVEFIFHLGARTDTVEFDRELLRKLNTAYTQQVWKKCVDYQIPMVYASSAATYGLSYEPSDDNEDTIDSLTPLNPYGDSKQAFDLWALAQAEKPFYWAGLKFFNVYGPNEYHKSRMASVVYHAFHQISKTDEMKLFRSHHPDIEDGHQRRDFIYVKDVVDVLYWLMRNRKHSGIYNLGTGKSNTFIDLANAVFDSLGKTRNISFIDTPEDIREKYQYFTEAKMTKLRSIGYEQPFQSLEEGVQDYVNHYLMDSSYF